MEKMRFAMKKAFVLNLLSVLLLGLILAVVAPLATHHDMAFAFDAPPKDQGHSGPGGDGPPDDNPDDPDQEEEGDPVQLKTGNFSMQVEDAALDSFTLPISMVRSYNNLDSVNDGPFGRGWSASFVMSIREVTRYPVVVSSGSSSGGAIFIEPIKEVVLRDDTGANHTFSEGPGGTWIPERARFGTLVQLGTGRYTWTRQDGVQFRFANNRLDRIVDLNGNALVVAYDGAGRIVSVTNPAGRSLTYAYNAASKIASITDSIGRTVTYSYNAANILTGVTNQLGNTTSYRYDAANRLDQITSADGTVVLTNTYDTLGRVTAQTAYGATFNYTYNSGYTRVRNSRGGTSDHYFNDNGNPVRVRDLRNGNKYTTYDAAGNLTVVTDQVGNTTTMTYDAEGNILTVTAPNGGVTTFTYGAFARTATVTDPLGRVTTMAYDARGNLTSVTDPLGLTESFTYDAAGRILSATDRAGNTATYGYNASGDLVSYTDENGLTTQYSYDGVGRLVSSTNAAGETTTMTYNARNRMTSLTDPLGKTTTYGYNANDERTTMTDPLGQTYTTTYDGFGRVVAETTPLGHTTSYVYDSLANLTRITDPEGRVTNRTFDAGNLLTRVQRPDGSQVNYVYDAKGRLTRVTDPRANITNFTYDNLDWQTAVTFADGSVASRTYDLVGRITQYTDRKGAIFTYAYDAKDRRTLTTLPNDGTIATSYDARSNVLSMNGYEGTTTYSYDSGSRLLSETGVWGDRLDYGYDAADRLTSVTRPSRYTMSYAYDANGRMTSATMPSGTSTYAYDGDDRLISEVLPNGVTVAYGYDADDRITSIVYTAPDATTVLMSNTYTYDDSGLITSMTEQDGTTHVYGYDGMIRLVSEIITPGDGSPVINTVWTYDPNGNRLTQNRNGVVTSYVYNVVDELTGESTGVTYSYDDNGNLLTTINGAETETYAYDDLNRLTSVTGTALTPVGYGYDGDGTRVRRTVGGTEMREVRWGDTLIEEQDTSGAPVVRYDYGLGLSGISGSFGTRHYMTDAIANVRALSGPTGALTDTYDFGAHGDLLTQTGATPNPYIWNGGAGYYTEGIGQLYHVGARFYDSDTSRFIQTDPVRQGYNPYRHAMANPLSYNDPSGEFIPLLALCARGAASGLIEDEITHHAFDGKEERTWTDRAISAGIGCLTGGLGNKARRAANAADAAADAARRAERLRDLDRATPCSSFDPDTLVLTDLGLMPIIDIEPGKTEVLARDEETGTTGFREVLALHSNDYDRSVDVTVRNLATGTTHTITSNMTHPYFTVSGGLPRVTLASSQGHFYGGPIEGGTWTDASQLRPGDKLKNADQHGWSEVVSVSVNDEPIRAYNLSVAEDPSFFVTGADAEDSVWVHNCPNIPKPPRGRGSADPSDRDPQRAYSDRQRRERHEETGGRCEQCGNETDLSDIDAHHIDRHADGGRTTPENQANVCKTCHRELHSKD